MLYRAIDWDIFPGPNPFRRVKFFREEPVIRPLTADEAERIQQASEAVSLTATSGLQRAFGDIVAVALNTGMRKSEILHLAWADIREGEAIVKGKGSRTRRVPLNVAALEVIGRQPRAGAFVFDVPNRDKGDLMRRTVAQVARLSGVAWHFHLLRHRFASALMERGVDIVTIGEILGHSRVTTSLIYSHTTRERKAEAVSRLADTRARDQE
jgi:integrase